MPRWSRFGQAPNAPSLFAKIDAGTMRGWREGKFEVVQRPVLAGVVRTTTTEATVDIQEFDALCALKSALHAYATLDEMADDRCEGLLRDRTHAQLDALMAHQESRIFHDAGQLDWNPRVLLMNDGGAADVNAHLAAGLSRSRPWSGSRGRCSMTPIDVRRAHSTPDDPRRQKGAGAGRTPASGAGIPHRSSLAGPRPRACARKRRSPTIALSL